MSSTQRRVLRSRAGGENGRDVCARSTTRFDLEKSMQNNLETCQSYLEDLTKTKGGYFCDCKT